MERQPSGGKDRERTLAPSWWRWGAFAVALVALSLCLSACGGSASPGVASIGSTTTTAVPAAAQGGSSATNYTDAVAYAACMRTHGVPDFPDPNSNGNFLDKQGVLNGVPGIDQGSSLYQKANKACLHLLPNGGEHTAAEQQQAVAELLKYAECMRSHGISDFPDPTTVGNGGVGISINGGKNSDLNFDNPQFQAAQKACQSLMPAGAP